MLVFAGDGNDSTWLVWGVVSQATKPRVRRIAVRTGKRGMGSGARFYAA